MSTSGTEVDNKPKIYHTWVDILGQDSNLIIKARSRKEAIEKARQEYIYRLDWAADYNEIDCEELLFVAGIEEVNKLADI